jgi:Mg-chelatase subunit ChlD
MRPRRKWVLLLVLLASLLPAIAVAYEGDHYVWTYYIALQMGFSRRQAFQIASAAYAIDWDKDTGPMEAKPGDVIYGARYPGPTGNSHPQIASIWANFHAFAEENYVGVGDEVEKARARQKVVLWNLAVAQKNPGPLIHYTQDYFSHFEFDNVRGHAVLGHKPDFIAFDKDYKARSMTKATVEVLRRFMREVLGGQPKEPNWERLWEVLDRIAAADPVPNLLYPGNFNPYGGPGSPSLSASLGVVRAAIAEDETSGLLKILPEDWGHVVLPSKWYQYEYDATGRVTDPAYAVETPKVELLKAEFATKPIDNNNFTFALTLAYRLSDFKALKDGDGVPFLTPLPVYERHLLSDAKTLPRAFQVERGNGEFTSELEVQRSRVELEQGVTWTPTIFPSGFDSSFKTVTLPVPPESKAAQECKELAARALKLLQAGEVVKAAAVMEEARLKPCDGLGGSVDAAFGPVKKQLEESEEKLGTDAKAATDRCEYEEALEMARMLQKVDPQSPWLSDNLPQIEAQAEGQKEARVFVKQAQEAIRKKDLDGAIALAERARGVAGVPQCMIEQIDKVLGELRAHKDFIKKTADVEAATTRCDYKEAARLIGEIQALAPREQYVADWLAKAEPVLKDLQDRERRAIQFIQAAQASANQANTASQTDPVDWTAVQKDLDAAFKALTDADAVAPACLTERKEMEAVRKLLLEVGARKTVTVATSLVLLIDASGSMSDNNKIFQAKVAAKKAAGNASKTTEIAVLSFDGGCDAGSVRIVNGFSTDPNAVMKAIEGIQPGGGTPMYIATGVAVDYAQKYGKGKARAVVLMSDGGDSCRDKQAQAAAGIQASNIPVSTIGFDVGNNKQAQDDMNNLSRITGGRTFQASAADPREIIRAFNMALLPSLLKDIDVKAGGGTGGPAVQGYYMKAKSLVQQQDLDGAIFQFKQANQLAPGSPSTNFNLSLLYEAQDQLIPALTHANNYLQLAPMAADRGDVENRVANLQEELRKNPRTQLDPAGCREVYSWAQGQQDAARKSGNVTRRQAIIELLIAAQKGDCENARRLQASYREKYP